MRLSKRDQIILAEAYGRVYLAEEVLPDNLKQKVDSFVSKYGQQIKDFLQRKFPDFYEKLQATGGDPTAIRSLVTPYVQNPNAPIQEGILNSVVNKAKDIMTEILSAKTIGNVLVAIGLFSLGMGDAMVKGLGADKDLLINGIVSILTGIYLVETRRRDTNKTNKQDEL
jgi:hypothetical protein